jgi:hypothetical protein
MLLLRNCVYAQDDAEGWQYGVDFQSPDWFSTPNAQGSGIVGSKAVVLSFNRELM